MAENSQNTHNKVVLQPLFQENPSNARFYQLGLNLGIAIPRSEDNPRFINFLSGHQLCNVLYYISIKQSTSDLMNHIISYIISYPILSYPIVDLKRQNRLKSWNKTSLS